MFIHVAYKYKTMTLILPLVPGEVSRPPPVDNADITSSSAVVTWNPPIDPNGVVLSYTVNFAAVSMVNSAPQDTGRRRRQTSVVTSECILGGEMNIDRNITVVETTATLTNLSECTYFITFRLVVSLAAFGVSILLAPDTVYEFRVQAETTVGAGPFSTSRSFTTREDGMEIQLQFPVSMNLNSTYSHAPHLVPTEPRELTISYLNSTALEVTWQNPLCGYGVRRGYTVSPQ